jgi:raffinose/stachyose/melibiose transport system permease protein
MAGDRDDATARGRRRRRRATLQRTAWLWVCLAPAVLLMLVFTTLPALASLAYSLYDWESFRRMEFVGLANFRRLLSFPFQRDFLRALGHNAEVCVVMLVGQNGLALLLAVALASQPRGFRVYRVVTFLPVILSLVIVGFLWQLFLNPLFGPVNKLFRTVGLPQLALAWLGDAATALPTLMVVNIWRWVGFPTLVFLAGLNAIPEEYHEAARLDGASAWNDFRFVTLPLLAPAFTIVTLLTFIGTFEWFELPYVMGGVNGPPAGATDTLALMFYRTAFGSVDSATSNVGLGAAISTLLFLIVGTGSVIGGLLLRRREVEL